MTDNEKRAHDLAISYYKEVLQFRSKDTTDDVHLDIYQIYKELYESSLNAFNRDYPNGK